MFIKNFNYLNYSNKPRCVSVDNQDSPLICIDIWCKAGIAFEKKNKEGIAHFLEHMIFKGSNKLLPGEFDYKIESIGGSSNASTGYDDAHYYVLIPPDNFTKSLGLLTNLVLNPKIEKKEFEKEKSVVIEEIKQQNDQPDELLFNIFLNKVWGNNLYSKSILGEETFIREITLDDLLEFHAERYSTNNLAIAVSGKVPEDFESIFFNLKFDNKKKPNDDNDNRDFNQIINCGREVIKLEKIHFSRILMAWQIPSNNNQRLIIGFEILASILSDGKNSKLSKPLKEEKSLVESIYVDVNAGEFGSILILEASCEKKNLSLVEGKINEIINDLVNESENIDKYLKRSINIIRSNYFFNLETSSQLSEFFGNNLLWGRYDPVNKLDEHLNYWDNKSNFREILKYLNNKNFTLIAETLTK